MMRVPVVMALALLVASATIIINIKAYVVGSWDPRYAEFNGTHVYQTAAMPATTYKTLYLGYGTAYFMNPVNVYFLQTVRSDSVGGNADLGRYLPIKIVVESGSLPTNTYIKWTDPLSGATRALYFVEGANRAYVIGTYKPSAGTAAVAAIAVYYVAEGSRVALYPMEKAAVQTAEACNVVKNAGISGTAYEVYAVLENQAYNCVNKRWASAAVGWALAASSAATAALYPSPNYYTMRVTSGSNALSIYLSYWYAVDADPGFFAVRVG
jgi:hypothetical protein